MWLVLGKSKINVDVSAINLCYRYLTAQANFYFHLKEKSYQCVVSKLIKEHYSRVG